MDQSQEPSQQHSSVEGTAQPVTPAQELLKDSAGQSGGEGFHPSLVLYRLEQLRSKMTEPTPLWHSEELVVRELWQLARLTVANPTSRYKLHLANSPEQKLVSGLCADLSERIQHLSPYLLSTVAESLAVIGYRDSALFKAIGERVCREGRKPSQAQVKRYLWAMAQLDIHEPQFVTRLVKAALAESRNGTLSERSRAHIAISLARLRPKSVPTLVRSGCLEDDSSPLHVWANKYYALLLAGEVDRTDKFERRKELFNQPCDIKQNDFERSAEVALRRFLEHRGVQFCLHTQFNIAGLFPDMVLYLGDPDRTVAIELDGVQYHFSWGPDGGKRLGRDLLRRQVLEAHGVEVVNITSRQWHETPADIIFSEALGL